VTELMVHGELGQELQRIAERENRPVDDVLRSMIDQYTTEPKITSQDTSAEATNSIAPTDVPEHKHWGQEVLEMLDQLELRDWETLDTVDPVEWMNEQRLRDAKRRGTGWSEK